MKKNIKKMVFVFCAVSCFIMLYCFIDRPDESNQEDQDKKRLSVNSEISTAIYLSLEDSIALPNSEYCEHGFTCTGLAYDSTDDCFWIVNFGMDTPKSKIKKPSIIKLSKEYEILDEFDLDNIEDDEENRNFQGIAYDNKEDCLWLTGGKSLLKISKKGKLLNRLLVEGIEIQMNGVAYDSKNDSLWILCYTDYLLNISKDGVMHRIIPCNIRDQDHLAFWQDELYFTGGADYYNSDRNYLYEINTENGMLCAKYILGESYAIEGICFLDGKLFVANDGYYHEAKIPENNICIYKIR